MTGTQSGCTGLQVDKRAARSVSSSISTRLYLFLDLGSDRLKMMLVSFVTAFNPTSTPYLRRTIPSVNVMPEMHADGVAATAVQYMLALPTMCKPSLSCPAPTQLIDSLRTGTCVSDSLLSAHEYMTHKYLMHLEFNLPTTAVGLKSLITQLSGVEKPSLPETGHIEHHAETLDDMSLRNDERWRHTPTSLALDHDIYRGTAFRWQECLIVALTMPVYVVPTYALMGWSFPQTMAIFLPCLLLHMLVWNALHPPMHGLPPVPAHVGPPSFVFADFLLTSSYGKFLFENHQAHHVLGGQSNYNIVCPLFDHLLGTYVPPSIWQEKMHAIPQGTLIRGPVVAPAGVPQPPPCAVEEDRISSVNYVAQDAAGERG